MPVKSIWTVTYDLGGGSALVLVTPDLKLEEEIALETEQASELGTYLESNDEVPLAFGNRRRQITLSVIREHASPEAARLYLFTADLAVPVNVSKYLHFQISGGAHYKIADCVFTSWRTELLRTGLHRTKSTWTLSGGALAVGP